MVELNEAVGESTGSISIACECSRIDCVELVEIPSFAYQALRASPRTFAVRTGHVTAGVERVVSSEDGYAIVEVIGQGIRVVEASFDDVAADAPLSREKFARLILSRVFESEPASVRSTFATSRSRH